MNILVTGANGQLGLEIRKIVDKMGNGHPDHNDREKNYYIFTNHDELDITDAEKVKEFVRKNFINVIINCAAYTAVDKAEDEYELAGKINAIGPKNLAEAAKQNGCVLVHISTDYVFDGLKNGYYDEKDEAHPRSAYGSSKRFGELNIKESGCKYLIFRTSWLYGGDKKNFVRTMFNLIKQGKDLRVVRDQFGNPTYCVDLANFLVNLVETNNFENRNLSREGIYHFSNDGTTNWFAFTKKIQVEMALNGLDVKDVDIQSCATDEYPTKAKRPANSAFCLNKLRDTFNYTPRYWGDALSECIKKYIEETKD